MPLSPHQVIHQYEILSQIGSGGMGEVFRARDILLNRDVAIKVLPGLSTTEPDRLRRFEQEAQAAAALNHPNILAIYQMGTFEGSPYLVSELLEGETLRERLKRGPLPVRKVIDYGAQIARGLAAAHEKGIVHRDIKPENIFLTKDGQVKILDFGLARLMQLKELEFTKPPEQAQTIAGMVLGTVGYMSPEQVRGQAADHRSDIFAFAAVLHEMLGGKRAFLRQTSVETMSAILNEEPASITQLAPGTPIGLQKVLMRGLEKNPEQRFQSASDLGFALEALSDGTYSTQIPIHESEEKRETRPRGMIIGIGVAVSALAGVVLYSLTRTPPVPHVSNFVQLTHDGLQKSLIGTDGSRLFLTVVSSGVEDATAIQVSGGEESKIPMPGPDMVPVDLAPDGSSLLVVDGRGYPSTGPFWSMPLLGGSPRRLGDTVGQVATWSVDGKTLAYANGEDIFLSKADGTDARKLLTMRAFVSGLLWSPEGTHLRVSTSEITHSGTTDVLGEQAIWDVTASGANPHQLFAGWQNASDACCGRWVPDGKYFVFQSQGQLWAVPREGGLFRGAKQPTQLTSSPMELHSPIPSRDGKKLFVVGRTYRGELTEFNVKTGQSSLFFSGMSADWIDASRDGKQVAYVSYPQGDLWRSNTDGTERVQLTFPPSRPVLPRWSPDGKQIAYFEFPEGPDRPGRAYTISTAGGTPHELMPGVKQNQQDPGWSSDGKRVVFAGDANDALEDTGPAIKIYDLQTKQVSGLPGSRGLFSPRWSPDGRYIAAMTNDSGKIMLFDFESQQWREIGTGTLSWLNWSRDGQYIVVKDSTGKGSVERIRLADGKVDHVVDLKDFAVTGLGGGAVSIAPDDSVLVLRDRGTQDVYALDWAQP
jgi:serine/threonine protein kinase/dipeptidyl aminopeptidase/acylaminoacyl peptidase